MEKKNSRITIRLSQSEMDQLRCKVTAAGYGSAGAFIRDTVATGNIKTKIGINVVFIAIELVSLAAMIKADSPKTELLEKIRIISAANAGGVA